MLCLAPIAYSAVAVSRQSTGRRKRYFKKFLYVCMYVHGWSENVLCASRHAWFSSCFAMKYHHEKSGKNICWSRHFQVFFKMKIGDVTLKHSLKFFFEKFEHFSVYNVIQKLFEIFFICLTDIYSIFFKNQNRFSFLQEKCLFRIFFPL